MSFSAEHVWPLLFDDGGSRLDLPTMDRHGMAVFSANGLVSNTATSLFVLSSVNGIRADDLNLLAEQIHIASTKQHVIVLIHDGNSLSHDEPNLGEAQASLFHSLSHAAKHQCLISIVTSELSGFLAMLPRLADASLFVREQGRLALSAAETVNTVLGIKQNPERLGGASVHAGTSGIATRACPHLLDALLQTRRYLLAMTSSCSSEILPSIRKGNPQTQLDSLIAPDERAQPYNIHVLLDAVLDTGSFFEVQAERKSALLTGFAHLNGQACGIIASDPNHFAGCLDIIALEKASHFLSLCNKRGLPVISMIDVPGFIPGESQEHAGIAAAATRLMQQWQQHRAQVITLVIRNALGPAGLALGLSSGLARRSCLIWSGALISAGGKHAAASVNNGAVYIAPHQTTESLTRLLHRDAAAKPIGLSMEAAHVH